MAFKDRYGAIAIQTSSQTLPRDQASEKSQQKSKNGIRSRKSKSRTLHPVKKGMVNAGQQLDLGGTENPMELIDGPAVLKFKDTATSPKTRD